VSKQEVFLYGTAGAAFGAFVVLALPAAIKLHRAETQLRLKLGPLVGALGIMLIFGAIGGLVAIGVGGAEGATAAKTPTQAITYGLGWQGLLGAAVINIVPL
jgi:hypothetical protein